MAPPDPHPQPPDDGQSAARFRLTLVRVMAVQAVTLALLWVLQTRYTL